MRKYWAIFNLNIQNSITYRGSMLIWLIGNLLGAIVMILVWQSSTAGKTIGGYTKPELINYYLIGFLMQWLIGWYVFDSAQEEIRSGSIISKTLLKPVSHFWRHIAQEASWHLVGAFFALIALVLAVSFFQLALVIPSSPQLLMPFVLSLFLAALVNFGFGLCMALLALWFSEVHTINYTLFWGGMSVLGGQGIPLSFIPGVFHNLAIFLPYRYAFSFPLEIYFSKLSPTEIFFGLAMQAIWVTIFVLTYKLIFRSGLKSYAAFGQ